MTTLAKITIALIMTLFMASCGFDINFGNGKAGNGVVVDESRWITDEFTQVTASEGLDVYVKQADEFEITVEADENIIDLIGTDIKNGKLRIHAIENIGRATKKVHVSLPNIESLKGSSGAHLRTDDQVTSDKMEIDVSSGAVVSIEVKANELDIDASNGANLNISGEVSTVYIDGSSGSNIRGKDLNTKFCNADASSGANISINVSELLTADASSGGNISYSGDANVKKNKSVSGSVHKY